MADSLNHQPRQLYLISYFQMSVLLEKNLKWNAFDAMNENDFYLFQAKLK